jgi:NADH-quinone oxidoreductase subunit G
MIDLCPVGALTSKPFRYKARSWELSRRRSISAHDSLGTNLAIHTKNNQVVRVLPIENEDINECWLSDKDRFAYDGLNSSDRLTKPMIKQDGKWLEVEWQVALEYAANGLRHILNGAGAEQIAALATGVSTLEELYLLQKLVRGLGSDNVDFRLRQSDFRADGKQAGVPWLGMSIAEISRADRLLIVGSFLRKDHPLLSARIRQVVKKGAQANLIHATDDDLLMPIAHKVIAAPDAFVETMTQVLLVLEAEKAGNVFSADAEVMAIAKSLAGGERVAVLLGNFAQQHPQAAELQMLAQRIANLTQGKFGFIGEAANSVGAYFAHAIPSKKGLNAAELLSSPRKAYILLNVDPELDTADSQKAMAAVQAADLVISLSAYKNHALDYADVILPIAPFTETSGTFISTEGRVQSFKGAVKPLGEARPAWKVLRVLGNLLKIDGFNQDTSEAVRDEVLSCVDVEGELSNIINGLDSGFANKTEGLQRISDVPIYSTDSIVRHSQPLQLTVDAALPKAWLRRDELVNLGLQNGDRVKVSQGSASVSLTVAVDDKLPKGVVRVAAGHRATAALGAMFGSITVERA